MKKTIKSNLITISALSDECGADRRTIAKYAREAGVEPVKRKCGAAYYDKAELLTTIADLLKRKEHDRQHERPSLAPGPLLNPLDAVEWIRHWKYTMAHAQLQFKILEWKQGEFHNLPPNMAAIHAFTSGPMLQMLNEFDAVLGREVCGYDEE